MPSLTVGTIAQSAELQDLLDSVRQTTQFLKGRLSFTTPDDNFDYLILGLGLSLNAADLEAKLAAPASDEDAEK